MMPCILFEQRPELRWLWYKYYNAKNYTTLNNILSTINIFLLILFE